MCFSISGCLWIVESVLTTRFCRTVQCNHYILSKTKDCTRRVPFFGHCKLRWELRLVLPHFSYQCELLLKFSCKRQICDEIITCDISARSFNIFCQIKNNSCALISFSGRSSIFTSVHLHFPCVRASGVTNCPDFFSVFAWLWRNILLERAKLTNCFFFLPLKHTNCSSTVMLGP